MAREPALAFINPRLTTGNVGDLFIEDGAKRILRYDGARSVDIDPRTTITDADIARINACDAAVIVGTNLWYRRLHRPGRWQFTADQLARVRVPIVPIGVGTTRHAGEDNGFDDDTARQLRLIHASCAEGGVRDLRTAEALADLGIGNVRMTGCPTLYSSLSPTWRLRNGVPETRRVATTVRKGHRRNLRVLLRHLRARSFEPFIAAQRSSDLFAGRWGPVVHTMDLAPYLDLADTTCGAIGWRLHGNMLHLARGNVAVFFANCSRGESFCTTFALPCVVAEDRTRIAEREIAAAVERLHDRAGFAAFAERYAHYYGEMRAFLEANRLPHNLGQPDAG